MICCSRNISDYHQCWKQLCCTIFCVETVIHFTFQDSQINRTFKRTAFIRDINFHCHFSSIKCVLAQQPFFCLSFCEKQTLPCIRVSALRKILQHKQIQIKKNHQSESRARNNYEHKRQKEGCRNSSFMKVEGGIKGNKRNKQTNMTEYSQVFPELNKTKATVKAIVHPKMKIYWNFTHPQTIQDIDEFVSSLDLKKRSIESLVDAVRMRVQTADKNITIIHSTPVHQFTSGEEKSWNKSSIKMFLMSQ